MTLILGNRNLQLSQAESKATTDIKRTEAALRPEGERHQHSFVINNGNGQLCVQIKRVRAERTLHAAL